MKQQPKSVSGGTGNDVILQVRLSQAVKDALKQLAHDENMTMSEVLRREIKGILQRSERINQ